MKSLDSACHCQTLFTLHQGLSSISHLCKGLTIRCSVNNSHKPELSIDCELKLILNCDRRMLSWNCKVDQFSEEDCQHYFKPLAIAWRNSVTFITFSSQTLWQGLSSFSRIRNRNLLHWALVYVKMTQSSVTIGMKQLIIKISSSCPDQC